MFIIDEVTQPQGDEVTKAVAEPFVLAIEMMPDPKEVSVDPILTPAPHAEVIVKDISVTDFGMAVVQTSLPIIQPEETIAENPSHDLQYVMESGSGTEEVNLTSSILNVVDEVANLAGMGPTEGKYLFLCNYSLSSFSFYFL